MTRSEGSGKMATVEIPVHQPPDRGSRAEVPHPRQAAKTSPSIPRIILPRRRYLTELGPNP